MNTISLFGLNFMFNFRVLKKLLRFYVLAAMEYHNLNTSIATRDFWVITGRNIIV